MKLYFLYFGDIMNIRQTSESIELAFFLAICGGFMDAYSYICRGGVFANAQTGNILLFSVNIAQGNIHSSLKYIYPVLFFSVGILLSDIIKNKTTKKNTNLHWRQIVIIIEAILFFIVAFIPLTNNLLANNITSMACGMQVEAFRKFHGSGAATTMCIGNLRSGTENLYTFFQTKEKIFLYRCILYYFIIFCFALGAVLGDILVKQISRYSILFCIFILVIAFIMMNKKTRNTILNL